MHLGHDILYENGKGVLSLYLVARTFYEFCYSFDKLREISVEEKNYACRAPRFLCMRVVLQPFEVDT